MASAIIIVVIVIVIVKYPSARNREVSGLPICQEYVGE